MTDKKPGKPWVHPLVKPEGGEIVQRGLTLRDYFAGHAMQGILGQHFDYGHGVEPRYQGPSKDATGSIATEAYAVADAMLARREDRQSADPLIGDEIRLRTVVRWLVRRSNPLALTNDALSHDCLTGECDHENVEICLDRLIADFLADLGPGPGRE